jgi:hypothetical protein
LFPIPFQYGCNEEPIAQLPIDQFLITQDDNPDSLEAISMVQHTPGKISLLTLVLVDMSNSILKTGLKDLVDSLLAVIDGFPSEDGSLTDGLLAIYAFDGAEKIYKIQGFTDNIGKLVDGANYLGKLSYARLIVCM